MGCETTEVAGTPAEIREISAFLAKFVQEGGLQTSRPGNTDPNVWESRLRWWWDDNPFHREDSPTGVVLRSEGGEIVGFHGFIPLDYEVDGEIVPSLVATTFFVEREYRSFSMGILAKLRKLARDYQIVDGSPSEPMRELLDKMGYQWAGVRHQYFFPLGRLGGELSRFLLRGIGLSFPVPRGESDEGFVLVNDPAEIGSFPRMRDGKLRLRHTVEFLEWILRVGTDRRQFFGLLDRDGNLVACAIGIYRYRCGVKACMLMDYRDFSGEGDGIARLIGMLTGDPVDAGLDVDTDLVTWAVLDEDYRPAARGLRRSSILYYQLPRGKEDCPRSCVPIEGDIPLL